MWVSILGFLKNFDWIATALKTIKEWFTFERIIVIAVFIVGVLVTWYFYAMYTQQKQIQRSYKTSIELKELELKRLEAKNKELIKTFEKVNKEHKEAFNAVDKLHQKKLKREVKYAKQKERNKHLKDGNLSPVLIDTFERLRSQESNRSANKIH